MLCNDVEGNEMTIYAVMDNGIVLSLHATEHTAKAEVRYLDKKSHGFLKHTIKEFTVYD